MKQHEHVMTLDPDGTLRCSCGLPHGRIAGCYLRIESRHRGEVHVGKISLATVLQHLQDCATVKV
jgi:hypothetical protein